MPTCRQGWGLLQSSRDPGHHPCPCMNSVTSLHVSLLVIHQSAVPAMQLMWVGAGGQAGQRHAHRHTHSFRSCCNPRWTTRRPFASTSDTGSLAVRRCRATTRSWRSRTQLLCDVSSWRKREDFLKRIPEVQKQAEQRCPRLRNLAA